MTLSKMPQFLEIKNPSFGFQDGQLVEIRFDVEHPHGHALMRLRGSQVVKSALAHIGARSSDDVASAYAMIDDSQGNFLTLTGSKLATADQAHSALETFRVMADHEQNYAAGSEALKRIAQIKNLRCAA